MPKSIVTRSSGIADSGDNDNRRETEGRWVLIGVPEPVRTAMRDAARREGVTLGAWMERVLGTAIEAADAEGQSLEDWVSSLRGRTSDARRQQFRAVPTRRYF